MCGSALFSLRLRRRTPGGAPGSGAGRRGPAGKGPAGIFLPKLPVGEAGHILGLQVGDLVLPEFRQRREGDILIVGAHPLAQVAAPHQAVAGEGLPLPVGELPLPLGQVGEALAPVHALQGQGPGGAGLQAGAAVHAQGRDLRGALQGEVGEDRAQEEIGPPGGHDGHAVAPPEPPPPPARRTSAPAGGSRPPSAQSSGRGRGSGAPRRPAPSAWGWPHGSPGPRA